MIPRHDYASSEESF